MIPNLLEESRSVDYEVGFFTLHFAVLLKQNLPLATLLVPYGLVDRGLELDILAQVPLLGRSLDVSLDLRLRCIEGRPIRVPLKWENVNI